MNTILFTSYWCAAACLTTGMAFAQVSGGAFRGAVRDPSNAVVPQTKISIHSLDQGIEISSVSNGEGQYVTPTLIPGAYLLTATKSGFKTEVFGPVQLRVNDVVRVDFLLDLGATSESIQVEASGTQLLATEGAEISQVIAAKQVSEIPLNQRNWQQLITLSAGVNAGAPGETGSPFAMNVNGQRTKGNLFLVDGISTTSSAQGRGNGFNIPLEAVREFSVQAGSYSAEFGDVAGGVINLLSKSGTNHWRGTLFEFVRNDKLDASNFFSNATGQSKNPLRFNQFGGSIGGPIRRDRTFLFADYQTTIKHTGTPMITTVPLVEQRRGDFSRLRNPNGTLIPIYDPFSPTLARTPFAGNVIPETRLDPAALKLSALLPLPNQFDASGQPLLFNNYAVTRTSRSTVHAFDVRLDHQISVRSSLFFRHSFQDTDAFSPSTFGLPLGGLISGAGPTFARTQNSGLGHIYQLSPTLIHEAHVGLNRLTTTLEQEDYGLNLADQFGIPGVNRSPQTSGLSTIAVSGLFNLGGSFLTPLRMATTNWNLSEKLIWSRGRHTLRLGFDFAHEMGSSGYLVFGRGMYTFLNLTTSTAVGPAGGNAYASFLLGAPFQVSRDDFPPGMVGLISSRYGLYAQDDFRVTPRLTINIGARYDVMPYAREKYNRLSNFDPATRTMLIAGKNTSERLRDTDYKNLAPRVGLAFSPRRGAKSVIRAGYGIAFIDPVGAAGGLNSNQFNIPFYFRDNITQFPFTAPTYTLSKPLPALVVPSPLAPTGDQRYLVPNDRNQYSQTWSFSFQQALNSVWMAEAAYVGTSGNRLLMSSNINAGSPGTGSPTARRPFGPALGEVRQISNGAHSVYHGLQTKIEGRFAHGLYFLSSYTWSKSLDNQSNGTDDSAASGQSPQNPWNPGADRGLSSFDRTHRWVASAVWEIPFFALSKSSPPAAWMNRIFSRWQLSGIFQAQSGSPFSVLMPCATINAEGNNCRPNRIGDGALAPDQRSINRWFDTGAFVTPSPAAYGNAGRNILRGPGITNVDLALSKTFSFSNDETRRIQIRFESFNTLNHTNFGIPIHSTDSPALGTITSSAPARIIQIGGRLEF